MPKSQHKLGSHKSELWALGTQTPGFTQQRGMPQPGCLLCRLNCRIRAANTRRRHHHPSWLHSLPTPMPPAFATHSALCSLQVCPELADSRIRGSGPPRRPHPSASGFPEGRGAGGGESSRKALGRRQDWVGGADFALHSASVLPGLG